MHGHFFCDSRGSNLPYGTDGIAYFSQHSIVHASDESRHWSLEDPDQHGRHHSDFAHGVTLCFSSDTPLAPSGIGRGFEYHTATNTSHVRNLAQRQQISFVYALLAVFRGKVGCADISLSESEYAFFSMALEPRFDISGFPVSCAVLYF